MVGQHIELTANDGHKLGAYRADPEGAPRGAVVVLQEIFGVNTHIRAVCDRFAAEGYIAVAPALFDRFVRDFESGYSAGEIDEARRHLGNLDWDALLADTHAAVDLVKAETSGVAVVGFCLGGSVAFLAAAKIPGLVAASCYYGGQIRPFADNTPLCPTMMHFGETDHSIPLADVEDIRARRPDVEIHLYPAGHGFNCDERASFDPESAALAWRRTLELLNRTTER